MSSSQNSSCSENNDLKKTHPGQYWREMKERCRTFLTRNCIPQFVAVLDDNTFNKAHYAIKVDYLTLFGDAPFVGQALLQTPLKLLDIFDAAARRVLTETFKSRDPPPETCIPSPKLNLHVRIHSLPICKTLTRSVFPSAKESGDFLCLYGSVIRAGTNKILEYAQWFECSRCKQLTRVEAPPSRNYAYPKTALCPNLCPNAKVTPVKEGTVDQAEPVHKKYRDYQEIILQEQIHKTECGAVPKVIDVVLEDDLVNATKPGDDVTITGHLYLRWKSVKDGLRAKPQLVFKANHVQVNNDQRASLVLSDDMRAFFTSFWDYYKDSPFEGRNIIISSFCPQIYGMYIVKLALCMVLAGGVSKTVSGSRIRGQCHMLMVGDPGTGKSQLLKYAAKISPRSVLTTGVGTSSAGLTVSASKDKGEWHLEAGALVLSDGGVCCIDEFSCIKEHDRTSIHEAMEQQSISIAKAGIVNKLKTRVTVLAATNPKGKYDPEHPLHLNIGIASPLLSRFDIVMVLTDAENDDWDEFITDFVLFGQEKLNTALQSASDSWDMDRLQTYLVMVKELSPILGEDAAEVLHCYYMYQRGLVDRDKSRTSVRLLESLRRLSEGHAKLMCRTTVTIHDAITAIALTEASMQSSTMVGPTSGLHTAFPVDAMQEYEEQARLILSILDLPHLWEKESAVLAQLRMKNAERKPNGFSLSQQRPSTFAKATAAVPAPLICKSSSIRSHPPQAVLAPPPQILNQTEEKTPDQEEPPPPSSPPKKRARHNSTSSSRSSSPCPFDDEFSFFLKNNNLGGGTKSDNIFGDDNDENLENESRDSTPPKTTKLPPIGPTPKNKQKTNNSPQPRQNSSKRKNSDPSIPDCATPASASRERVLNKLGKFKRRRPLVISDDEDDD